MRFRAAVSYSYFVRYRSTTLPTGRESREGTSVGPPKTREHGPPRREAKPNFRGMSNCAAALASKNATRGRLWLKTNDMCRASYSISSSSVPHSSQCERFVGVADAGGESSERIAPDVWLRTNVTSPTRRTSASRRTRRKMLPRARSIKSCDDPLRLLVDTTVRYLRAGTWTGHELCLDGAVNRSIRNKAEERHMEFVKPPQTSVLNIVCAMSRCFPARELRSTTRYYIRKAWSSSVPMSLLPHYSSLSISVS